jgi:uncharacterized membrane protein
MIFAIICGIFGEFLLYIVCLFALFVAFIYWTYIKEPYSAVLVFMLTAALPYFLMDSILKKISKRKKTQTDPEPLKPTQPTSKPTHQDSP